MKTDIFLLACAALGTLNCAAQGGGSTAAETQPVHVAHSFEFTINAPQKEIAPLFGADRERVWAEGWNPQFVYPQPAQDRAGAVFTVHHRGMDATWINTIYQPESGRIQYAYVVAGAMVTLIDIHISSPGASQCRVQVTYERTALAPEYNSHVRDLGEADAQSGPQWQREIESYLKKQTQK